MQAFEKYVNLPEKPTAVIFETLYRAKPSRTPGPADWSLLAVLTYDQSALPRIEDKSHDQKDPVVIDVSEIRPWFPQALRDALVRSADQGYHLPGPAYQASKFLKVPLNDGTFTVLDSSGYLFLQMDCCGPLLNSSDK